MSDLTMWLAARDTAIRAALEAGRLIRAAAGRLQASAVRSKGINDLVTDVDEQSQSLIVSALRNAFPGHGILAEEVGADLGTTGDYRWVIDPIDGTTNFAHGVPPYAVSIALLRAARPVVGVVLDVSADDLFVAVRGHGASMNGRPIRVSDTARLDESLLTTGFPYRSFGHADVYLAVLKEFFTRSQGVRRPGSASVDLCWVACGRFDGFFETGLAPWDVAAGVLLVEEAGGLVTDFGEGLDPVTGRQIHASNGIIHAAMTEVLAPLSGFRA